MFVNSGCLDEEGKKNKIFLTTKLQESKELSRLEKITEDDCMRTTDLFHLHHSVIQI